MKRVVYILSDGKADTHVAFESLGYATLCGMDGDDPGIGQETLGYPAGAKVSCEHCKLLAQEGWQWELSDFK